jgi:hypothetical protein
MPPKVEDFEDSVIKYYPEDVNYCLGFTTATLGWFNDHWLLSDSQQIMRYSNGYFTNLTDNIHVISGL